MKRIITAILLLYSIVGLTQTKSELCFEKGSRVCFVGNSITNNGEFHHNVLLYYITRFPDQPVRFLNCGISGDITSGVLNRMEDDILVHQPSHAVVMLGMNDVNRSLYGPKATSEADTLRRRAEAINTYKVNLEKIVTLFLSKNIKVILEKPSIYDQTAVLPAVNNFGVNDALKICADFISILAEKYKLPVVDYWTILNQINLEMQKINPSETITGPDRIHPASTGHFVMAYEFLKSENAPKYVSKIVVGKNTETSSKKSLNCEIQSLSKSKNEVKFAVRENALPFPTDENQQEGLRVVQFMNELNIELLQLNDLNPGQYQLMIDEKIIGVFSDLQFGDGINLAEFKETPQYGQAMQVRNKLEKLWQMESALRGIKFIEYNPYFKTSPEKKDLVAVKSYLDSIFKVKYNNSYYNFQLAKYIENKPKQKDFEEATDTLNNEIYRIALPVDHLFTIKRVQSNNHINN